ncbi:MAG: hypothetical protein A2817_01105 [Candidatus Yanofskybacteria bacterium RIFCSPHIGHO2_01_FULL_39_8b]|uniref:RNA polymerase Rpb4/RPC9 core domain-containing protein n=1 Tax=Candidatus Yanofskybacteria bacterium RIFCSPHIGHO2_01_FULL_39_8b TaxID=1802659 RepID=A0A1F8EC03_9BACT|nr:MAG: hypothetical protein A2817_01105 [Candidatus Yanofskybacteria bacterium RIFCSPHIGHO2_01_FULL_39_8b]
MASLQFIEEKPISLVEVRSILTDVESRDTELNYRSTKVKEFLENFGTELTEAKKEKLLKKLKDLNLVRLKDEYYLKIIDFLPTTANDLKIVLQAYPVSLPKKDMDSIVEVVTEFAP